MRVAITGSLGVNGVFVVRSLRNAGVEILATNSIEDYSLAPDLAGKLNFRIADVTDQSALKSVLRDFRPDVIIHLAAILPVEAQADPYRGYAVNIMGTANVLAVARDLDVARVVFTSSKAAYGEVTGIYAHPTYKPLTEDDAVHPKNIYDHAKVASECLGLNYQRCGGPEFAALRFATIFGPGKVGKHGPMSQISGIVEDAVAGRPVRIRQGGDQGDDYIYVRDAATAIVAIALHKRPLPHAIYNVGSGVARTLFHFADILRGLVPSADIEIGPGLDPMGFGVSYYSALNSDRAKEDFGFEVPELAAALRDYVQILRERT
ncbi:MAG TPA: NAD(P)-dependent oxidoreductase [Gammaproteobacteria bacterium]|nr:NAD(P)-dependent oxidoreductase [Gammaproteobacteria bacterium]|tara:strand:- start:570 stop:1529 length:960 start_codon:yes stop_codon:yes gene_type:complete